MSKIKVNPLAVEFIAICALYLTLIVTIIFMVHYFIQEYVGSENLQALDCLSC